jgi:hypothetical protein
MGYSIMPSWYYSTLTLVKGIARLMKLSGFGGVCLRRYYLVEFYPGPAQEFKVSPVYYAKFQKNMPQYFESPGKCIKY